jgi:hypothetical protein
MKKVIYAVLALGAVTGIAVAASQQDSAAKPVAASPHGAMAVKTDTAMPSGHPAAIPADTSLVNSGKVLEVVDSPTYSYLQVTSDKGPLWLAAYKMDIAKGATVKYSSGIAMPKFYSKSLDRTFDEIVFVDTLELVRK